MRILYLARELWHLLRQHRLYFLAPLFVVLVLLSLLVFYIGPGIAISFLYAGV